MIKKRIKIPTSNEFDWYCLQGKESGNIDHCTETETSTRIMQAEPFQKLSIERGQNQLLPFQQKASVKCKVSNVFIQHDNKNIFDNDSAHFMKKGKRRCAECRNLTENDMLYYNDSTVMPASTYSDSYKDLGKLSETTSHRRFPKEYADPKPVKLKLETPITWFNCSDNHKYSTNLLVNSLPIATKQNPWKYAYSGSTNVYPR